VTSPRAAGGAPRIRRLDPTLIDQIAAGEVVERPASVVKELVENALDAGASRVRVELRDGGIGFIAVTDDGSGMTPEEARLALERHATSKLAEAEDLRRIGTFGFRGEALPAIASVSRLRLRTRTPDAEQGFEIRVEAGKVVEQREASGPPGTRIEVADLFAAIPARRKFLKTPGTEWGHAADWLARAALALPGVHFDVRRDGRDAIAWPAVDDPLERIAAVLSEREAAALVPVERREGAAVVWGFASRPDHHRGTATGLYLFVNGRPVRDRLLRHAVVDVYRDLLPRGRFPTAVLHVDVPPDAVDVNVHPAKWEVRFADPRSLHRLVAHALRGAIESRGWLRGAETATPGALPAASAPRASFPAGPAGPSDRAAEPGPGDWLFARRSPKREGDAAPQAAEPVDAPIRFSDLTLVGQILATYLVVESKDALLLVDQHAAHERVLYERLRAAWLDRGVERQALLVPATVELEPAAVAALGQHAAAALRLGFELEAFGESAVVVRALPALLAGRSPAALVRGLADELRDADAEGLRAEPGARTLPEADRALATLACHSARRAGEPLVAQEQRALLDSLDTIPWAPTCPHGRPVAVPFERAEIERRFGRR
jgi:DNA mismatch repair protein MutL